MYTNKNWKLIAGLVGILLIASMAACVSTDAPAVEEEAVSDEAASSESVEETTSEEVVMEEETADTANDDFTVVDEEGNTSIDTEAMAEELVVDPNTGLTQTEIEGLLFMREEEKLARDVYLTLYEQYQMNIFQNIANSEQTHTDSIKFLLDLFGLEDPMTNDEIGVFENETLQQLYDDLVAAGSQSLADAIKVGAAIEEIDILDLEDYISQTDNIDIQVVYENLTKGSRNHLRSFVSILERQTGEIYTPQYLSVEAYEAIIAGDIETSGNGGQNGRNGNGNGGNGGGNQRP